MVAENYAKQGRELALMIGPGAKGRVARAEKTAAATKPAAKPARKPRAPKGE